MHARLGINNCFAVKRWPDPADWASIVRDDLGLDTVELSLDLLAGPDTPAARDRMAEQTRTALARHGLRADTVFTGLAAYSLNLLMHPDAEHRAAARRWYQQVIDLTAQLGAIAAGGHVGTLTVPDAGRPRHPRPALGRPARAPGRAGRLRPSARARSPAGREPGHRP